MLWILFTTLSAILWAGAGLIDKYLVSRLRHSMTPVILGGMFTGLIGTGIILIRPDPISVITALTGMTIGVFGFLAGVFHFLALKREEASRVLPLWAFADILIILLAFLILKEPLNATIIIAMILVLGGSILIESNIRKHILTRKPLVLVFMLLAALAWALAVLIAEHSLYSVHPITLLGWAKIGGGLVAIPFFLYLRRELFTGLNPRIALPGIAVSYTLDILAMLFKFFALALIYAAAVQIVSASYYLFVFLGVIILSYLSPKFLKEKNDRFAIVVKLIATLLIIAGVVLMSLSA